MARKAPTMRLLLAVAILAGASVTAAARLAPSAGGASLRSLLQDCTSNPNAPGCKTCNPSDINGCQTCRYERVDGSSRTETKCVTCLPGHTLNADRTQCGCSPGYYRAAAGANCTTCGGDTADASGFFPAYYCPGGFVDETSGADAARQPCPSTTNMGTLINTAAREEQCVTKPGYGYIKQGNTWVVEQCAAGKFNPGKNRRACRACGRGLTTAATGSSAMSQCLAPDGYYFDKGAAKECPKGTWKSGLNAVTKCNACANGITTANTAANSTDACALAKKGWMLVQGGGAALCDQNTYADTEGARTACTPCSSVAAGLITLKKGAASKGLCVAPPGVGPVSVNGNLTYQACAANYYKAGYNLNQCKACPDGFLTEGTGAQSFSDCYIPAGWGTVVNNGVVSAVECSPDFYGAANNTYGVLNLPCQPCPEHMNTQGATGQTSVNACVTNPGYGYEAASLTAKKCLRGSYSVGYTRQPCSTCVVGFTTLAEASTNATACVTSAGFGTMPGANGTAQCPVGWYNPGLDAAKAACQQCPDYSLTVEGSLAADVTDCSICVAGYGKTNAGAPTEANGCGMCSRGFYNAGAKSSCEACPADTTSAPGSVSSENCFATWQGIEGFDNICTNHNETVAAASESACKAACTGDCMYYMWGADAKDINGAAAHCVLVKQTTSATVTAGFKVDTGVYQTYPWGSPEGNDIYDIGAQLGAGTEGFAVADAAACAKACDDRAGCLVAVHDSSVGKCWLRQPTLSVDYKKTEWRANALSYWSAQEASSHASLKA